MKSISIILFLFIISPSVHGQVKCKYEKNQEDPFTKTRVVITSEDIGDFLKQGVFNANSGYFKIIRNADDYSIFLAFFVYLENTNTYKISKDQQLILLLENKDTVLLSATYDRPTTYKDKGMNNGVKQYSVAFSNTYKTSQEQIKKLLSSKLLAIRIYFTMPSNEVRQFDLGIKEKLQDVLKIIYNCAMN